MSNSLLLILMLFLWLFHMILIMREGCMHPTQNPEEFKMRSIRECRYRGYCVPDMKKFDEVIIFYNNLRTDMYKLYTDCPLLDIKYVKTTIPYFDEFYKIINDPAALRKEFGYPC